MVPGLLDDWTGELMVRDGHTGRESLGTDGGTEDRTKQNKKQI